MNIYEEKKKNKKIMLTRGKLNSIDEDNIEKALIDSDISHGELTLEVNEE